MLDPQRSTWAQIVEAQEKREKQLYSQLRQVDNTPAEDAAIKGELKGLTWLLGLNKPPVGNEREPKR